MKKLLTAVCLGALATAGFAQGLVGGGNAAATLFRTNSVALGGTAGSASLAGTGGFFYELLVNQSTVTTIDGSLQGLAGAGWSDALFQGTNTAQVGRVSSGNTTAQNWPAQALLTYTVVGWTSAEGSDWATVSARLVGATLSGGKWSGGTLVPGGWVGVASVQQAKSGGGSPALASWGLFGAGSSAQGSPIVTPTDMFVVAAVPEPTTFALAGLGAAALMIFRRRK